MNIKRILTSLIGFPLVVLLIALGNAPIIDFAIMIIAIVCMYEYIGVIKKVCNPIKWIMYFSTLIIFLVSIVPIDIMKYIVIFLLPITLLILFLHIIISNMKITFKDAAYSLLGIIYITGFIVFMAIIIIQEKGKLAIGYILMTAWATDVFAYTAGILFGKHHFSKVSPKKTVEGCISGIIGAFIVGFIYAIIASKVGAISLNGIGYLFAVLIPIGLSIISQIGDFTASSIKRFADAKDYGSLLPGHGGMLDRIDSVIFIAPFVYMIMLIAQNF